MNDYIDDLQTALVCLKNRRILVLASTTRTLFLMIEGKIQVISTNCKYSLTMEDFLSLYAHEHFYVLSENTTDIEGTLEKDFEYYSWKHK